MLRPLALAAALLAAASCTRQELEPPPAGVLGYLVDRPAPPVTLYESGPKGTLLTGPWIPDVPDAAVDAVIAGGLRDWLTFEERRSLAMASEKAAAAATGKAIAWKAADGGGAVTSAGSVTPVGDVFRSLRGQICRDMRQMLDKNGELHAQRITLCRTEQPGGSALWVLGSAE